MSMDHYAPAHYAHGIEPIDYMRSRFSHHEMRGFLRGNTLKYLSRYTDKGGVDDLRKCRVYLDWLIRHEAGAEVDRQREPRHQEHDR